MAVALVVARAPGVASRRLGGQKRPLSQGEDREGRADAATRADAVIESGNCVQPGMPPIRRASTFASARFSEAARVVPEGCWTSYAEISAAVTGTRRAARAVGRAASRDPAFPNAWRVIHADGSVPDGWGGGGDGPARCRRLLEAEGVTFSHHRADPAKKLLAEEIDLLLAGEAQTGPASGA